MLHETGQLEDVEFTEVYGTTLDHGTIPVALNPLGKLPVLERADGPAIYDSRVICRFLDERAGAGLYPDDKRKWDILTLEATGDGILDAALAMVYEGRVRPPELQSQVIVDANWAKASRAIDALNNRWVSHLEGPLHIGQIAVACALGYADFRLSDRDWRKGNQALDDWFSRFAARDSFSATTPVG